MQNAPIRNGSIVRLPDATIGEACWVSSTEARIIHGDKVLGRGPWVFDRSQLELATEDEAAEYLMRCRSAFLNRRAA